MAIYFVDDSAGNDANDGLDNIGVGLATATWTEATLTLTQNGHGYTFAAGDVIYLSAGTGLTPGLYEVESSTANTIVLVETSTLTGVGNGSDVAAGDDATGDWASSDGPWLTIDKALTVGSVAAGDYVWIRSTGTYTESPAIDTAAGATTEIVVEGYTTTLGDNGQATIVGTLTDTIATNIMYCFKNIIFDANSANANCVDLGSSEITFRNCVFKDATGNGVELNGIGCFYECEFLDNGSDGCALGTSIFVNCKFYRNAASAIDNSSYVFCYNCVFFSNGTMGIDGGATHERLVVAINCTFDGDGRDTTVGIYNNASFRGCTVAINNIVYDCATGIESSNGQRDIIVHNLVNNNAADYGGDAEGQEGEVTGAPDFVDEAAGADYSLNASSPAKSAGTDYSADNMDMGAIQTGVGGGLLMANKRGGKQ